MTITNANFDDGSIEMQIMKMIAMRCQNSANCGSTRRGDFMVSSRESMLEKAATVGVLSTANEDVRSLREMITYGLKGMAAYAEHEKHWKKVDHPRLHLGALAATLDGSLSADDLVALTLKTGEYGAIKSWALLDRNLTRSRFGNRNHRSQYRRQEKSTIPDFLITT